MTAEPTAMPRATPFAVRQAIRRRSDRGEAPALIALDLGLPVRTVRDLLHSGKVDAPADYSDCGPATAVADPLRQAVLDLRAENPGWGAPFLRCWLPRLGFDELPSVRTIQRILAGAPQAPPVPGQERSPPVRPERAHEAWQVDAADQVRLAGKRLTCWLRFVDWASGAVLSSVVFPPGVLVCRA